MQTIKYLLIIFSLLLIGTSQAFTMAQGQQAGISTTLTDIQTIQSDQKAQQQRQYDWLGKILPYAIIIGFIAIVIFFPVFAGFMSATAGLIILGLIILLLGSCFTGGIVWEGSGNPNNIFNILLSHFYIYIGMILIILDLAMLGSVIISVIGVGFIAWDIGNSLWHSGKPAWGDIDILVFWGLTGITVITAFIYSLRKSKKIKDGRCPSCHTPVSSPEQLYCTVCGKELRK